VEFGMIKGEGMSFRYFNLLGQISLILTLVSFAGLSVFSQDWKGLVPCVSTRSDAERILGEDGFKHPDSLGSFRYKGFRVTIHFEKSGNEFSMNDLVRKIDVWPPTSTLLLNYKKDLPRFNEEFLKTELSTGENEIYSAVYRNWTEGIEVWVQKDEDEKEIINRFGYFDPVWTCSNRKNGDGGV
jgi:hypothetical protein